MRRSGAIPSDEATRSHFSKTTSVDERKRQRRDLSSSGSKGDSFVGSDDEDDTTNNGYFAGIIANMFQRRLPTKIKSELLPAAKDLDATVRDLQLQAEQVTAALEAEESAAKEAEDKAKTTLANVHESVLQAISSMHDSVPSQDADSRSP